MTTRNGLLVVAVLAVAGVVAACAGGHGSNQPSDAAASTASRGSFATDVSAARPSGSSVRAASVARATVSGPVTGGRRDRPFNAMSRTLAEAHGYVEEEFFVSGEATAYETSGSPTADGRWSVRPTTRAPYTTRLLVRRPADGHRFDGTVLVEWLNVSSGQDSDVEFAQAHEELMAHGTVWVGVSAQAVGVEGGASMAMPGLVPSPLKTWDPERYGPLVHPGDDYSYDVFSQAAAALLRPQGVDPLAATPPRLLLAAGESQSAARLVTYVNAVHPVADAFDGFLVHSRSDGGAPLHGGVALPRPARIRADLDVPVFVFETETDVLGLPFLDARQPDTDRLRTWEVAGTAHLDRHLLDTLRDAATGAPPAPGASGAATSGPEDPVEAECGTVNDGPQAAVLAKALSDLRAWAAGGPPPATGRPIEVRGAAVDRDELGIARGGVRTPPVDVPVAALRGDNAAGTYVCSLFGSTTAFDRTTLTRLHPDRAAYVDAVERSARAAVAAGHLREVEAQAFVDAARRDPRLPG